MGSTDPAAMRAVAGKLADAEALLRRALAGREAGLGANHPDTLASVRNLLSLVEARGQLADAEPLREWLRRAEE